MTLDRAALRGVLSAERAEAGARLAALERELASAVAAAADAAGDDEHDPEGSTTAFERAQVAAVLEQVRERAAALDAALDRVGDPAYGTCAQCGCAIDPLRLAARPWATRCVGCATTRPR